MKTRTLIAAIALLIPLATFAQPVTTQYAYTYGGASFEEGTDVGVDDAGNAYFIGTFDGTFDFDPGVGTTTLSSTSSADVYIVSYDSAGDFRFAFQIGNSFATSESGGGIDVAGSGAFYVTGSQPFGTIDYDPDPVDTEDRNGIIFIAVYDDSGDFQFALTPESAGRAASGIGNAIALDGAGNIYVTGRFASTVDFDPGSGVPAEITSNGSHDVFVASYTMSGAYRYAFGLGGMGWDEGHGVAADAAGNVYVTGRFSDTVSFDPDDTNSDGDTEDRTTTSGGELFLASYSPTGDFRFVYTLGNPGSIGYSLDTDAAGNVYFTGEFLGTAAFDPHDTDGNGDLEERTAAGNGSAFVAGYASSGDFRFVSAISGGSSLGRDVTADASGITFVTGTFSGTIDLDAGGGAADLSSGSGTDVFVASYDGIGAYRGGFSFGGDGLNTGNGIAIDALGNTSVTGEFTNTTDFEPDPSLTSDATSAGQNDLFLAAYSYEPIHLSAPPPPPSGCPDGLFIAEFDADQGVLGDAGDDTGEFVAIEQIDDEPVSLNDCALVFFDGRNDKSYFATELSGDLDAGATHLVGNPGVQGVDQTFPDALLQNGPDAITILDRSAARVPNRTHVVDVVSDVVAAVVYVADDDIFGQVPAAAKRAEDLPALLKSATEQHAAPESFTLEANYPNPFNPSTLIPFNLVEDVHVTLEIFDATGRRVATLIDRAMQSGVHQVEWNGRSLSGEAMPSGLYVYRIRAGRFTHARGMLLMK